MWHRLAREPSKQYLECREELQAGHWTRIPVSFKGNSRTSADNIHREELARIRRRAQIRRQECAYDQQEMDELKANKAALYRYCLLQSIDKGCGLVEAKTFGRDSKRETSIFQGLKRSREF